MAILIVGLALFLGVHSLAIVSPSFRARAIHRLGERAWKGLYALVSLVGFVLICYGFGLARQAPVILYSPPTWLRHVTLLLMLPVFPLLIAAYLPGRIKTGGQASDAGGGQVLGIRSLARQRFVGGRVVVRWIPRLGRGGSNLHEAPFGSAGAANRAARTMERCHRGRAGARDLRAPDRVGTCTFVRSVAAQRLRYWQPLRN